MSWSPLTKDKLQTLAAMKEPLRETARTHGINYDTLRNAAYKHGVKFTPGQAGLVKRISDAQMRDAKQRGLTVAQTAEEFGTTHTYIRRREGECGLKLKRPPPPQSREVRPEPPKAKPVTCATLFAKVAARENEVMKNRFKV